MSNVVGYISLVTDTNRTGDVVSAIHIWQFDLYRSEHTLTPTQKFATQ